MDYKIIFDPVALKSIKKMDSSLVRQILKRIGILRKNPYAGKHLGNKMGMNLTGYYKLYACNKKIRVVYMVSEKEILITIIMIGKREKGEVYKKTLKIIS